MSDPLEIELKLEIDPVDREKLNAATLFAADTGVTDHLVSTYFDTPDLALRDAGYTLRIRRKGRKRIQTVKAEGEASAGLFVRPEWERRIDNDTPVLDETSGPLAGAVGPEILARIGALFTTDVRRTTRTIDSGGATIEFAIDHGEVRAGKRSRGLCEIELELGSGSPQALFDFARRLDEEVPLRLGIRSKSERGYRLVEGMMDGAAKAEPIALDRDGNAGEAFQAIAKSCIRQFRLNEALLLETGEPEPLHQARVGLRRLRSAFSLCKPLLAGDDRVDLLRSELRWLAAELGEVRDLDVLMPRVTADVRSQLVIVRERIFTHVRAELASARTRLLMIDLAEWLALGDWRTRPADPDLLRSNVVKFADTLHDARRKRIKRCGKGLAALDDDDRHQVRIEAKKLRYATEFFASLYTSKKARRRYKAFRDALEEMQDHLGELNDFVTGPLVLAKLGIDAKLPRAGKAERKQLLDRAEDAYDRLIDTKRFWR